MIRSLEEAIEQRNRELKNWDNALFGEPNISEPEEYDEWNDTLNYPSDLNAMHEAESSLRYQDLTEYERQLEQKCWHRDGELNDGPISLIRATAAQRAEAFLRTLNLWRDDL